MKICMRGHEQVLLCNFMKLLTTNEGETAMKVCVSAAIDAWNCQNLWQAHKMLLGQGVALSSLYGRHDSHSSAFF